MRSRRRYSIRLLMVYCIISMRNHLVRVRFVVNTLCFNRSFNVVFLLQTLHALLSQLLSNTTLATDMWQQLANGSTNGIVQQWRLYANDMCPLFINDMLMIASSLAKASQQSAQLVSVCVCDV
jgi:hypothetical protein